jgi:hypothetical protein
MDKPGAFQLSKLSEPSTEFLHLAMKLLLHLLFSSSQKAVRTSIKII